ncbi:MAG: hypothetical protein KUG74_06665 [Rhodobacteraceae bacterium]|nr:hypothetical protein [Paracoccaceae bacterium]
MIRHTLGCLLIATASQAGSQTPPEIYGTPEVVTLTNDSNLLFVNVGANNLTRDSAEEAAVRMDEICTVFGLQEAARRGSNITEVTIRLSDRPLGYGETDPEVVQFMSFYDISTGECIWH